MAPVSKENEILTIAPETATAVPSGVGTETSNKPLPVALEVPVTVNGARTVEGSDKREPFSETTKTVLVFGNGAVIRLSSPVSAGQLLFLTNEKTKKEVVCQVVKSKNYRNVSGYVELEFTESVVGFWGMRFPSDRIGVQAPASAHAAIAPPVAKSIPVAPISAAPKVTTPVLVSTPKIAEVTSVQIQAEVKPALPARPVEVKALVPSALKPHAPSIQNTPLPVIPKVKKSEAPAIASPAISTSLASSVASLLDAPEAPPASTTSESPALSAALDSKQGPAGVSPENSSEELKLQAARLQEQLSAMLFSGAPTAKPAPPAPPSPALDSQTVLGVAAKVLEIAKSDPAPVLPAPPAKVSPPPIQSSLDTEEVKIPSWLEPLARNAAAPTSTQELIEREKAKHAVDVAAREEHPVEPEPIAEAERAPEIELPGIGSLLPLDEDVITHERQSSGSHRGILFGTIAATALLAAGGAWYLMHPANGVQGKAAPITPPPTTRSNAALPAVATTQSSAPPTSQLGTQPASRNSIAAPDEVSSSTVTAPVSSASLAKARVTPQPAPVIRDNTRNSGTTIQAAATERISRPEPELEPKKPVLGEVHLASPTVNRPASAQDDAVAAPTISAGDSDAIEGGLNSGLSLGNSIQPAGPEVPLPAGGEVKSAKLVSSVPPAYPLLAKNQHVSGNVLIDALIDANGRVTTMKVISGPALLHRAAMEALKQWKYQPASLDGKPVAMHLTVTLQFRLQ